MISGVRADESLDDMESQKEREDRNEEQGRDNNEHKSYQTPCYAAELPYIRFRNALYHALSKILLGFSWHFQRIQIMNVHEFTDWRDGESGGAGAIMLFLNTQGLILFLILNERREGGRKKVAGVIRRYARSTQISIKFKE